MPTSLVVFDLDGTLIDTAPDLVATLNAMFAREGLAAIDYASGRNLVGGGARALIERGLYTAGRALPTADVDRMVADFITHYAEHIADESRPFPGLTEALDALASCGCRFAVCTNKLEWLARRLLEHLGLAGRFASICGADTFGVRKPDPEILRRTIHRANSQLDSAVMVGDSITDIATARAAPVPVIAVDFGYSDTPVKQLGPDRVISAFSELPEAIATLSPKSALAASAKPG